MKVPFKVLRVILQTLFSIDNIRMFDYFTENHTTQSTSNERPTPTTTTLAVELGCSKVACKVTASSINIALNQKENFVLELLLLLLE